MRHILATSAFWIATAERVASTFLQTLLALLTAGQLDELVSVPTNLNVATVLTVSAFAAFLALVKALIAGLATSGTSSPGPSLVSAETVAKP